MAAKHDRLRCKMRKDLGCSKIILRKIFGAKRDEETDEWRKLHNIEWHQLYNSSDIINVIKSRRLRWTEHVTRVGKDRTAYRVLVDESVRKRPLSRLR